MYVVFQLFEGLKAYRGVDNKVRLFRPYQNIERMLRSAERSALPVSFQTCHVENKPSDLHDDIDIMILLCYQYYCL